jgi:RNA polymerase sigma factor (sigma-70 family)
MSPWISDALLRSQSDERLVDLARAGHERAFVAIVQRYRRPLNAHARRLATRDAADDVLQQAWLRAWAALRDQAEVHNLRAWLYRIVLNVALDLRAKSREEYEPLSESVAGDKDVEREVDRRMAAHDLLTGIAALPERQREALVQTALAGRSSHEVATALGASEAGVRKLVQRARVRLRATASAIVPIWLVERAAGRPPGESLVARAAELGAGAGAGAAATAAKLCITAAVTGALVVGPLQATSSERGDARAGQVPGSVESGSPDEQERGAAAHDAAERGAEARDRLDVGRSGAAGSRDGVHGTQGQSANHDLGQRGQASGSAGDGSFGQSGGQGETGSGIGSLGQAAGHGDAGAVGNGSLGQPTMPGESGETGAFGDSDRTSESSP